MTQREVLSPYDGSVVGAVDCADEAAVEEALTTAYALYRDRRAWLPTHERVGILERTAQLMEAQEEALALQAAKEGGKPLVDSRIEAARAIDGVRLAAETIRAEAGEVIPMQGTAAGANRVAFTQREPIGVVVAVSAFNHPLNLIVHQVAAGVAAGCAVIVKPADDTPLSCLSIVQTLQQAGLPEAWCQFVLPKDIPLAERLVTDSRVGFFSFIGSAKVGWMLRSKLAPGTRCALEHGGAAPLMLAEDADLDLALQAVAKGGFYHAGQVCVSVQRVFAHRNVARSFAEHLAETSNNLKIGDPARPDTDVGPLIRPGEVDRVDHWVQEAVAGGAELLSGGQRVGHQCYAPTVLFEPPEDARVSREEIFGPVVCIYAYDDLDEALRRANTLPFAF
ncbi:MAG: aldehyde dehydrogenase family protein, partial [Alphaproteobacteria bacterium]